MLLSSHQLVERGVCHYDSGKQALGYVILGWAPNSTATEGKHCILTLTQAVGNQVRQTETTESVCNEMPDLHTGSRPLRLGLEPGLTDEIFLQYHERRTALNKKWIVSFFLSFDIVFSR
jgi:hypothetical protein